MSTCCLQVWEQVMAHPLVVQRKARSAGCGTRVTRASPVAQSPAIFGGLLRASIPLVRPQSLHAVLKQRHEHRHDALGPESRVCAGICSLPAGLAPAGCAASGSSCPGL